MKPDPLTKPNPAGKLRTAIVLLVTAWAIRWFGREMLCERCGQSLGRVLPMFRKGNLRLHGLDDVDVFVDFLDRNILRFRHMYPSCCKVSPLEFK